MQFKIEVNELQAEIIAKALDAYSRLGFWQPEIAMEEMIRSAGRAGPVTRLGVVRAYATRHGQGPFPTENAALTKRLPDADNTSAGWQGDFRVGWFDTPLARYALRVCPVDVLAVTCLDRMEDVPEWWICDSYRSNFVQWDDVLRYYRTGDLSHQERLGLALTRFCDPDLLRITNDPKTYARILSDRLGVPLAAMSFGPAAEDKRWL